MNKGKAGENLLKLFAHLLSFLMLSLQQVWIDTDVTTGFLNAHLQIAAAATAGQ